MNLLKQEVIHQVYGTGIIIEQTDSAITVEFCGEIKKFLFPDSFEKHLKFYNRASQEEIEYILQKRDHRVQIEKETASAYEEKMTVLKGPFKVSNFSQSDYTTNNEYQHNDISEFKRKCIGELKNEIAYLKGNGGKRYRLFDGFKVSVNLSKYIYVFETDSELHLPEGTQITVWKSHESCKGKIMACEGFTVMIESNSYLGDISIELEFSAEPWRLLETLIEQLDHVLQSPSPIVSSLICDGYKKINASEEICCGQEIALEKADSSPIVFIWGPPGTGKTYTLAKIALEHIKKGDRILLVSHSNVSVDGAVLRLCQIDESLKAGTAVRYGYPRAKELLGHPFLTSFNLAMHKNPKLSEERTALLKERKQLSAKSGQSERYLQIGKRLKQIREEVSSAEKEIVRTSQFVATTISKAVVDQTIFEQKFDMVIFDEASMAYIPQIIFASSLARNHFCCLGDFCQLPPIVQSDASTSFLSTDIFGYVGIASAV